MGAEELRSDRRTVDWTLSESGHAAVTVAAPVMGLYKNVSADVDPEPLQDDQEGQQVEEQGDRL